MQKKIVIQPLSGRNFRA